MSSLLVGHLRVVMLGPHTHIFGSSPISLKTFHGGISSVVFTEDGLDWSFTNPVREPSCSSPSIGIDPTIVTSTGRQTMQCLYTYVHPYTLMHTVVQPHAPM